MQNHYAPPGARVADVNRASGSVSQDMVEAMRGTKPWVLLIGVLLFIFAVLMIIATVAIFAGGAFALAASGMEGAPMIAIAIFYGLFALIYFFLGLYLLKYNAAIGRLVKGGQGSDMEDALTAQRKFWRLSGVITLIFIILFVVGILAAILIPLLTMGGQF